MLVGKKIWMYWIAQIVGWGLFTVLVFALYMTSGKVLITKSFICLNILSFGLSLGISHVLRIIVIKFDWLRLNLWNLIWRSFLSAIILSCIYEFFDYFVSDLFVIDYYVTPLENNDYTISNFLGSIFLNSILFSLWLSFYYTYLFIEKSRNQEIKNLLLEASRNEIELKNLREQINPHFLFNSLNSIKALVEINKYEAKDAITKLSNLLRKSIQLSKNKLILIREELEIVETYINLEKIRFEERIQSTFNVDPNALNCKIPPLMIQTLVENAIKHGLSKSINGGILELIIKKKENNVFIFIKNTGNLGLLDESEGIGIQNTKKRLDILFGEESKFKIAQKGDFVCVEIQIVCKD
jgi:two-component system LytT family sensor kinase